MLDNWTTLSKQFAKNYKVYAIDQRNHGKSFHDSEMNYKAMAADLNEFMDEHNIYTANLIGHSMGGKTAMLFATKYPELVDKLIIADIAPKEYPPHHQDIIRALNSIDFTVHNSRKLIDEKLSELIPEVGVRQFILKNTYRIEKDQLAFRFNLKSLTENYSEVVKGLPVGTTYNGETLFLRGGKSQYILDRDAPLLSAHFPNYSLETVPNAGHWLHAENPKDFYNSVMGFIQ